MTHKIRYGNNRDQLGVLCGCGHSKSAHFVKKVGCITCDCRKYKERKQTYR